MATPSRHETSGPLVALEPVLSRMPELARVVVLGDLLIDDSSPPSVREHAAAELLSLSAKLAPASGLRDRMLGVVSGVSPRAMHARVRAHALSRLIGAWGFLPDSVRQSLRVLDEGLLSEAFDAVTVESGRTFREHAAVAAREIPVSRPPAALLTLLKDSDAMVRARALDSLESRCADAAISTDSPGVNERASLVLCRMAALAVIKAGSDPKIRKQAAACVVAMWSPSLMHRHRLAKLLEEADLVPPLQAAIRWSLTPHAAARAAEWLAIDSMAASSIERLGTLESCPERVAVASRWHLLMRPRRARLLSQVKLNATTVRDASGQVKVQIGPRGPLPAAAEIRSLPAITHHSIAAMCNVLGLDAPVRASLAGAMLDSADPITRLRVRSLAPAASLADHAFDPCEAVARGAAMRWLEAWRAGEGLNRSQISPEATLQAMRRSPHESVRAMARSIARPGEAAPGAAMLRQSIAQRRDADEQLQAMRSIGGGETLKACAGLVTHLADDAGADAKARATAMTLLGKLDDAASLTVLRQSIEAGVRGECEARVVANAIDALRRRTAQVGPEFASVIVELKSPASHQRVRASAIRLLAAIKADGVDVAAETLAMLRDPRPAHRLSGAWLAGRLSHVAKDATVRVQWGSELTHLADHATDKSTRARACQSLMRLEPPKAFRPVESLEAEHAAAAAGEAGGEEAAA
jgi:hypothetical protein